MDYEFDVVEVEAVTLAVAGAVVLQYEISKHIVGLYGGITGEVLYVSADTLKEETPRGEEVYYRVHVASKSNPVTTTSGKVLEMLPGMTAQVDIRTGDRTVMNFLLKPLHRTASEAFGER